MQVELERSAVLLLGWGRIAIGVQEMVAPGLLLRLVSKGTPPDPTAVALFRGFGARDAVVGAGVVWADQSGDAATRARWFASAAACDVADFVAMVAGRRLHPTTRALTATMAGGAAALGVIAALRARA
ncbi:MAG: hypothetical protein ACRD0U_19230 [Acidimicrobiales bacterium]